MTAPHPAGRLRQAMALRMAALREAAADAFWLWPAVMALGGIALAVVVRRLETPGLGMLPPSLVFAGDTAGARALLGVVAGTAAGVAGTIFSITIAALSLTSGQMGPRLLRSFLRDTGNKVALGLFLLTFCYAIALQRGMGAPGEPVLPHLGLLVAVGLALVCAVSLAWLVHHIAGGINVETVIAAVHDDLRATAGRLTTRDPPADAAAPPPADAAGEVLRCGHEGHLRSIDYEALADWAQAQGAMLRVTARPGDFLHDGLAIATVSPAARAADAGRAVAGALTLGPRPTAVQDLEFAVRQLVEIALRALSPGINDPFTAIAVIDRMGAVLGGLAARHLPAPVLLRGGQVVLCRRVTDYAGLCDAMFHMLRQAGAEHAAVAIRMVEVLGEVAGIETDPRRHAELRRHAALVRDAGAERIADAAGRADLARAHAVFAAAPVSPGGSAPASEHPR